MSQSISPGRRPLSVWEFPKLLQSVHRYRKTAKKPVRERPHFRAILAFVHRNRFAVASQIQRRFSEFTRSDRTARRHLSEMESLGYLDIVDTNNTSPLWPKVYFVTRRGLARLRKALHETGQEWSASAHDRRRSNGSSAQHILHEIFITEFLLMAWETAQSRDDLEILTTQRRSLAKHNAFHVTVAGHKTRLQPDGMFLYRQQRKGMMCCFVEIDLGSMSLKQMGAKFRSYRTWAESSLAHKYLKELYQRHGATVPSANFRLLIVTGGRDRQVADLRCGQLISVVLKSPALLRDRIWFTTIHQLNEFPESSVLLSAPLWVRLRDISATVANIVSEDLHKAPRHPLFESQRGTRP